MMNCGLILRGRDVASLAEIYCVSSILFYFIDLSSSSSLLLLKQVGFLTCTGTCAQHGLLLRKNGLN